MLTVRIHLQERDKVASVMSLCGLVYEAGLCPGVGQNMDYTHASCGGWGVAVIMVTLSLVLENRERHHRSERMVPPTIRFSNPSCDSCPLMYVTFASKMDIHLESDHH